MHDAFVVRRGERVRHRRADRERPIDGQAAIRNELGQRLPFDQLHRQEVDAVDLVDGVDNRVTTQLINASDGAHLWSERFDREMTEVFVVQDEIAAAIAGALKVKLAGQSAARSHDPNLAAYEAFLKGKHHYYQFSPEHFTSAERDFTQAIQWDPHWAEPHAALGDLYFAMGFYG